MADFRRSGTVEAFGGGASAELVTKSRGGAHGRPMALSHSGPEGVPQALDFMGSFGLASFRQKLLCRGHNVYKVYRLIGKPAVRKFIRMKPLNLRPHAITSITAS